MKSLLSKSIRQKVEKKIDFPKASDPIEWQQFMTFTLGSVIFQKTIQT